MTILEETKNFLRSVSVWIYWLLGFTFFFFSFGFKKVLIVGQHFSVPVFSQDSLSVQVFKRIQADFLPEGVHLVVTNPTNAFVSQILLSILLAFVTTFPFFLCTITRYLAPALHRHEKKLILWSLAPSILLFFTGCIFSYFFLVPATFKILYSYAVIVGAVPFFSINEFISSVLGLMIATGIMFLLPVCMVMLSFMGLVKSEAWRGKWRHAFFFFLVFTALITPDGTGITMLILFIPLSGLYFAGYLLTNRLDKSKIRDNESN